MFCDLQTVQDVSALDIAELEEKYFPDESPYGLFRTCRLEVFNFILSCNHLLY